LAERLGARGVRLKGGVYLRSLPFEDGSYDGVFSQFGIEYGERPAAFREAARVLRAGGCGLFVMHHRDSVVTRLCAQRLSRHRAVLGPTQCFPAAERVFTCHLKRAPLPLLVEAEKQFHNEVTMLRRRLGMPPADPNLVGVVDLLTDLAATPARYDPADALRRVRFAQEEIESWRLRQEAQRKVALDQTQLDAVCGRLAQAGLAVQPPDIVRDERGEIIAWALRVRRPATSSGPDA
jgi:SAM-dependent methyltransferase